ncbi:Ribonuclease 3 [Nymphon striatum]|nr:Ribonuclease 3 [Nymphon striatum]
MVKYPLISLITNVRLRYGWMLALLVRIAGATLTSLKLQPRLRLCKALPGIHVFTGCDYTSFCIRKGKKRPLKIAEENYSFLDAFAALATGQVDRATCEALEEYTSKLVIETKGPTNTRVYIVAVYFRGKRLAKGSGHSIQQAEMDAASNALIACKGRI